MNIRIICIGKLKEHFFEEACAEYGKRLTRYANVEVVELADERAPEQLSEALKQGVRIAEGRRILARIGENDHVVAMDKGGQEMDSETFALQLQGYFALGKSRVAFVVGGSLGLSDEVLDRADVTLSFGKNTYPHQLFRLMLLEQVYRAFRILNHEPYHK